MSEPGANLSQTLSAAASGDRKAAADLLPLVYNELRSLARARMTNWGLSCHAIFPPRARSLVSADERPEPELVL